MNVCVLSHLSLSSTSANIISYKCRIDVVSCVCVSKSLEMEPQHIHTYTTSNIYIYWNYTTYDTKYIANNMNPNNITIF